MTEIQIQIAMAQAYVSASLRYALAHEANDKGGFSEAQNKAWLDYDEALAILTKLLASKS